jgi:S1-C subfamily serine protease
MVFFLSPDEQVYARYGSRDASSPDARQSLDGLRYTMASVLEMHERPGRTYAPRAQAPSRSIRQVAAGRGRTGGCFHCHNVREILNDELRRTGQWERERTWRYPLPDNLGVAFETDRGNVVQRLEPGSAAEQAGLQPGDLVQQLNGVPIHALADAQYALDRAPAQGTIPLAWERAGQVQSGSLVLSRGWRQSDITWRASMQQLVPALPLYGTDLTAEAKQALGLSVQQLAFRQKNPVNPWAEAMGVRAGDIILGIDDRKLRDMEASDFRQYIRHEYLVGDRVQVHILRDGKPVSLPMTLR